MIMNRLRELCTSPWYWLGLVVIGVGLEAGALFYQYVLDYPPCVLCIHARIWVAALILLGVIGALLRRSAVARTVINVGTLGSSIGLLERSWQTLATERGWSEGSCEMSSGLPAWFALDKWIPWLFEVQSPCGYTPEILFGITMAESLVLISIALVLVTALMSAATAWKSGP